MTAPLYASTAVTPEERDARRKARKARLATRDRDEAIHNLREGGTTIRRIAEVVELPHTTVADILRRPKPG